MKKFIYILLFLPFTCITSYSQTADTPNTQPPPEAFPEYIVRPSEDLNPYGLSTLEPDAGLDYRDGAGTLGTKIERPSNVEANKKSEERRAKIKKEQAKQQAQAPEEIIVEDDVTVENFTSPPKAGSSNMIRWVDDEGVTHITNNLGAIPAKYRDQIK